MSDAAIEVSRRHHEQSFATIRRMEARAQPVMWLVVGIGSAALSITTIGLPGSLILAGAWALAAALDRSVPGFDGPISWAGGVLVEVILLSVLSAALALISPHPHGSTPYLAILAIPIALGGVGWFINRSRRPHIERVARRQPRAAIAVGIVLSSLGINKWVASLGHYYGVAWAMSGDARNDVLITRSVLHDGGLSVHELRNYPAVFNNLIALVSGAGGRSGLPPGQLMLHDAYALATTYTLSGIALALLMVAALLELLPRHAAIVNRLNPGVAVVLFACAATAASPLVLGTALDAGYATGYATLSLVLASIVFTLRACAEPNPATVALLGATTFVALLAWPILAIVPGVLVFFTLTTAVMQRRSRKSSEITYGSRWSWITSSAIAFGFVSLTVGIVVAEWSRLRTQLLSTGYIVSPQTRLLYLAGLLAAGAAFGAKTRTRRLQMLVPFAVALAGGLTVKWLMSLPASGSEWTYYAIKTLWLLASSLVWLAFVPALLAVSGKHEARSKGPWSFSLSRLLQGGALSGVALILIGFSTNVSDPLVNARVGWSQPSAAVVTETAAAANRYRRFVLWDWTAVGDERLGNFWAALVWDSTPGGRSVPFPGLPGGLSYWAYFDDGGSTPELCVVVRSVPNIVVITTNRQLPSELRSACPGSVAHVVVGHSPS